MGPPYEEKTHTNSTHVMNIIQVVCGPEGGPQKFFGVPWGWGYIW